MAIIVDVRLVWMDAAAALYVASRTERVEGHRQWSAFALRGAIDPLTPFEHVEIDSSPSESELARARAALGIGESADTPGVALVAADVMVVDRACWAILRTLRHDGRLPQVTAWMA